MKKMISNIENLKIHSTNCKKQYEEFIRKETTAMENSGKMA
jgi:hypothetical protein